MKSYIILGPRHQASTPNNFIAICDGFSWLAALFAPIWFLWRGMWLHVILAIIVFVIIGGFFASFGLNSYVPAMSMLAQLVLCIWFGLEARYYYIEHLQKQGVVVLDNVVAMDEHMAIELYLNANPLEVLKDTGGSNTTDPSNIISSYDKTYHADMIFGGH